MFKNRIFTLIGIVGIFLLISTASAAPLQIIQEKVLSCNDSDGGENFLQRGILKAVVQKGGVVKKIILADQSLNRWILLERTCSNRSFTIQHDCRLENMISQNGACVRPNRRPVIDPIPNQEVDENALLSFLITAQDPDNDPLTFSALQLPDGATFENQTFTWTPSYDQSGNYSVIFRVSDGQLIAQRTVQITVRNINRPPVFDEIGDREVNEGELLNFEVLAEDPDNDPLSFSVENLPEGASFDVVSRIFSWTPSNQQAGEYEVIFRASDGVLDDSVVVAITVNNANQTPILHEIGNRAVNENELIEFQISGEDPDSDELEYFAGDLPEGASFSQQTQIFSWTPTYEQTGEYYVTFLVIDEEFIDEERIMISVRNINRAPILHPIGDRLALVGEALSFQISATDPDNDVLTFSADNLPIGAEFDGDIFHWIPEQTGEFQIRFNVSDGLEIVSETIIIRVDSERWFPMSSINAPSPRYLNSTVWTGKEMIVWGGIPTDNTEPPWLNTGGRYDYATDSWRETSLENAPFGRFGYHTAVWCGSEMIIWGGWDARGPVAIGTNSGARYNPTTDEWISTSLINAPSPRSGHSVVCSGDEMIVWGGFDYDPITQTYSIFADGGRYNPVTDTWSPISTNLAPDGRILHSAVWANGKMIIWGGLSNENANEVLNSGGIYDPVTNNWTPTSITNAPIGWDDILPIPAIWNGSEMIIWGGRGIGGFTNTGARYNPDTDTWTIIPVVDSPTARRLHVAIWTGEYVIIWGGATVEGATNTGGRYSLETNTWTPTDTENAPIISYPSAVWTGSKIIIWGGPNRTGGIYSP